MLQISCDITFTNIKLSLYNVINFCRWDNSTIDELPGKMKLVFGYVTSVYDEFEKEMAREGREYAARYAKERVRR